MTDIYKLADSFEMPADQIDGMRAEIVHEGLTRAVNRAKNGDGPTLIEIKTYRYKGHSISDPQKYRTKEELEEFKNQDPILLVKNTILTKNYASVEDLEKIDQKIAKIVDDSAEFAENSPFPNDDELLKDIYVDQNYPFIID